MSTKEEASTPEPPAAAAAAADSDPAVVPKKEKKKPPVGLVIPPKKPKLSKSERRELQEQQRDAKSGGGGVKAAAHSQPKSGNDVSGAPSSSGGGGGGSKQLEEENQQQQPSATDNTAAAGAAATDPFSNSNADNMYPLNNNNNRMSLVSHLKVYPDASHLFFQGATLKPQLPISSNQSFAADQALYHSQYALHPAVIRLGYQYATGQVRGGNDRCRAMLSCFQTVLLDYIPPNNNTDNKNNSNKTIDLRQALDQQVLKPSFQFWTLHCRHHSVSMGNAFTFLKTAVSSLERDLDYSAMRDVLLETMQQYADERIDFATMAIADLACTKLLLLPPPPPVLSSSSTTTASSQQQQQQQQGTTSAQGQQGRRGGCHSEVILTYGYSEVISVLLRQAAQRSKGNNNNKTTSFRVIVVDSRPHLQGRRMLEELRRADIDCTYILLNALTYVLHPQQESSSSFSCNAAGGAAAAKKRSGGGGVTKVLLGAAALMSDGSVLGSIGTACVALCAHDRHVPVLFCCETYKISNRVQLDSLTHNELSSFGTASAESNDKNHPKSSSSSSMHHHHLNLSYDLTPATFVSGIVTELGIVPPTSVAVLLREMNPQGN